LLAGVEADAAGELACFEISARRQARVGAGLDVPASCGIRRRAAYACAPATVRALETPLGDARELLFDRVCYEIRCDRAADTEARERGVPVLAQDALGAHTIRRDALHLVCAPATITLASDSSETSGASARRVNARGAGILGDVALKHCGDFNDDATITASDALGVLR
jgi:hypothetical protein